MKPFNFENWTVIQSKITKTLENPIIFIGCMTGTSADSQADFTLTAFDEKGMPIAYLNLTDGIPQTLCQKLYELSTKDASNITTAQRSHVEAAFTEYLTQAFIRIIQQANLSNYPKEYVILSPHGQSIDHQPLADPPYTDILLNGDRLAELTGYIVVSRHRQMPLVVSMAAPLAPVLIAWLFHNKKQNRVLLNGGGIANICVLLKDSPAKPIGYDTGPANGPMDELVQYIATEKSFEIPADLRDKIKSKKYDVSGTYASRGKVIPELLDTLLEHEYFKRDIFEKSADRAAFSLQWVLQVTKVEMFAYWVDVFATVAEMVAKSIADGIIQAIPKAQKYEQTEVITYGGLSHNQHVMQRIQYYLNQSGHFYFTPMTQFGYDPNFFESLLMAYLGYCAYNGIAVDLSYCAREGYTNPIAIPGSISKPASLTN